MLVGIPDKILALGNIMSVNGFNRVIWLTV